MNADFNREIRFHPRSYAYFGSSQAAGKHIVLDWSIRPNQAALVLVDVWNWHFLEDAFMQIEEIVATRLAPLTSVCRAAGFRIIHAPASPVAEKYSQRESRPSDVSLPPWPPADFRAKRGVYQKFAGPRTPMSDEIDFHRENLRDIHPLLQPTGNDIVITTGFEMQKVLAHEQRLFLFYAGFHNNACLLFRDYGMPVMIRAGYETILVRDCTTALESHETRKSNELTKNANISFEVCGGCSITSTELIESLRDSTEKRSETEI